MDKIAVLIPCYNEEKTIAKVVTDTKRVLPEAVIYVYNNNSSDRTAELAEAAGAVVRNEYMQGKGNVIRRMFREIDAECYIMVDGDDTYPMENAPEMVDLVLNKNADMVVGDRLSSTYFTENKRPFHNFGNSLVRGSINRLFDCKIKDIMTGYRAFSYDFVKTFPVLSRGFEIETEMTIHAVYNNMQIENVVVDYRDRPEGSTAVLDDNKKAYVIVNPMKLDEDNAVWGGYLRFTGDDRDTKATEAFGKLNGKTGLELWKELQEQSATTKYGFEFSDFTTTTELSKWILSSDRKNGNLEKYSGKEKDTSSSSGTSQSKEIDVTYVAAVLERTVCWKASAFEAMLKEQLEDWVNGHGNGFTVNAGGYATTVETTEETQTK